MGVLVVESERGGVVRVGAGSPIPHISPLDGGEAPGAFEFDKFDLVRIGEILALVLTALALVFFVLRPLVAGLFSKPEQDELPPEILKLKGAKRAKAIAAHQQQMLVMQRQAAAAGEGASGNMTLPSSTAVGFDLPSPERLDAGIDVARISGQVKASSIKKISEVVSSHPDESIAIIRSWLAEESSDRAA